MVIITIFSHRYKKRRLLIVFTRKTLRSLASLFFSVHRRILLNDFPQWPIEKRRVSYETSSLFGSTRLSARIKTERLKGNKKYTSLNWSRYSTVIFPHCRLSFSLFFLQPSAKCMSQSYTRKVSWRIRWKNRITNTHVQAYAWCFVLLWKLSLVSASRLKSSIADLKKKRCSLRYLFSPPRLCYFIAILRFYD